MGEMYSRLLQSSLLYASGMIVNSLAFQGRGGDEARKQKEGKP